MNTISQEVSGNTRRVKIFEPCNAQKAVQTMEDMLAQKLIDRNVFTHAVIEYWGRPDWDPTRDANYPLRFYDKAGKCELWVSGPAVGERSGDSQATIDALELMGFMLSRKQCEEIYTKLRKVQSFFKK